MRKVSLSLLCLFCLCGTALASPVREVRGDFEASTSQAKFVKALVKALDPESMTKWVRSFSDISCK